MMHGDRKPNFSTSMILIGAHLTRHGTCMVSQTPVPERDGPRAAVAEYRHSDECPARASARATTGLSSFCTLTRRVRSLLVPRSTSALVSKSSSCLPTPPHAFHIIILLRHTCQLSLLSLLISSAPNPRLRAQHAAESPLSQTAPCRSFRQHQLSFPLRLFRLP